MASVSLRVEECHHLRYTAKHFVFLEGVAFAFQDEHPGDAAGRVDFIGQLLRLLQRHNFILFAVENQHRRGVFAGVGQRRRLAVRLGLLVQRAAEQGNEVLRRDVQVPVPGRQVGRAEEADHGLNAARLVGVAAVAFQAIVLVGDAEHTGQVSAGRKADRPMWSGSIL